MKLNYKYFIVYAKVTLFFKSLQHAVFARCTTKSTLSTYTKGGRRSRLDSACGDAEPLVTPAFLSGGCGGYGGGGVRARVGAARTRTSGAPAAACECAGVSRESGRSPLYVSLFHIRYLVSLAYLDMYIFILQLYILKVRVFNFI